MRTFKICIVLTVMMAVSSGTLASSPPFNGPWVMAHLVDYNEGNVYDFTGYTAGQWALWNSGAILTPGVEMDTAINESSWGVFKIDSVEQAQLLFPNTPAAIAPDLTGDQQWADIGDTFELVGMFYGLTDHWVKITDAGTTDEEQRFLSSGLQFDLYYQPKTSGFTPDSAAPAGGPTARHDTNFNEYAGLIPAYHVLHAEAVNFFRETDTTLGTLSYSSDVTFNPNDPAADLGEHIAYLQIDQSATDTDWYNAMNSDIYKSSYDDTRADMFVRMNLLPGVSGWSGSSSDPIYSHAPLPGAALLGLLGLGSVAAFRGIRRKVFRK